MNFSRAVEAFFGKNKCDYPAPNQRTLLIEENELIGPGYSETPVDGTSGLYSNFVCGGGNRTVEILENLIYGFNHAGLELDNNIDVQVSCNNVLQNRQAVEFTRSEEPSSPGVRFLTNRMSVLDGAQAAVRTENAEMTELGPDSNRGGNEFRTEGTLSLPKLILEDEPGDSHDSLDARQNYWFKADTLLTTVGQIATQELIWTTLTDSTDFPRVNVSNPNTSGTDSCWPGFQEESIAAPTGPLADLARADAPPVEPAIPLVTRISDPFPNPTRSAVALALEISANHTGQYKIDVFDVRGRRVALLVDRWIEPGRYRVEWSGRDRAGKIAAPGAYFVRLEGPGIRRTAKVVRIR